MEELLLIHFEKLNNAKLNNNLNNIQKDENYYINAFNSEFNKNYKDIFNHRILYTSNNSKDKSLDKSTNSNNYIKASSIKQ